VAWKCVAQRHHIGKGVGGRLCLSAKKKKLFLPSAEWTLVLFFTFSYLFLSAGSHLFLFSRALSCFLAEAIDFSVYLRSALCIRDTLGAHGKGEIGA